MGGVQSKLKVYVRTKVDNTKLAIQKKIDDTQNAIVTKICDTRDAIIKKTTDTVFGVVHAVVSRRDRVIARVVEKKNQVVSKVISVKDGVVSRVNRCVEVAVCVKNTVCTTVVNTKNAVVQRVTDTRDAIVNSYVSARDRTRARYRAMRERKYTRWEKLKYGSLAAFILLILGIASLTLLDVYLGDYAQAEARLQTCWSCVCTACDWTRYALLTLVTYLLYGLRHLGETGWYGAQVLAHYTMIGTKWLGHHTLIGVQVAGEYCWYATKICAEYTWLGVQVTCSYLWLGTQAGAAYSYHGATVAVTHMGHAAVWSAESAVTLSKLGYEYASEGAAVGAEYAARGLAYSYEHGSVALKDGSIRFYHYSIYFLTNFRVASAEAVAWSWEASKTGAVALVSWTCHALVFLAYFLVDSLCFIYNSTIAGFFWLYTTVIAMYQWTTSSATAAREWTKMTTLDTWDFIVASTVCIATAVGRATISAYDITIAAVSAGVSATVATAQFLYSWGLFLAETVAYWTYVAIGDYGFRWAVAIGDVLSRIFTKFFTDLAFYVTNFVRVTAGHLYTIAYVIFSFAYYLITGVGGIVKVFVGGAVYITTAVFKIIIWVLQETLLAYAYAMHKYNRYREILFLIFIGFMSVYCSGLMKDRRRPGEEERDEEDSDEEEGEGEIEGVDEEITDGISQEKQAVRPPPVRRLRKRDLEPLVDEVMTTSSAGGGGKGGRKTHVREALMPSYDADSSDDDIPDFSGYDDMLDLAAGGSGVLWRKEDEFIPDQDVPDFAE